MTKQVKTKDDWDAGDIDGSNYDSGHKHVRGSYDGAPLSRSREYGKLLHPTTVRVGERGYTG